MVTKELYKLTTNGLEKDGHEMSLEDVVKELNAWRNEARSFRNKNAKLLQGIGKLEEERNNLFRILIPLRFTCSIEDWDLIEKLKKELKIEKEAKNGKGS